MKLTVLFISHDLEEAITLGDQVIFLSKRPACVSKILKIDLAYPRTPELTTTTHFNHLRENALEIFQANLINNDYKKSNAKQQLSTSR